MGLWLPNNPSPEAEAVGCAPEGTLPQGEGQEAQLFYLKTPN